MGGQEPEPPPLKDFTVAYVTIKTEPALAEEVAAGVSAFEADGVRWAVVVAGPTCRVIAGIRVSDNEALGLLLKKLEAVKGIKNPDTAVMTSYWVGGRPQGRPINGPP